MRFGLFGSAQANSGDLPPETGQGFRDYLDFNVEAEALGFHSTLPGRAPFHRLEPGLRHADAADLPGDAHHHLARRFGRDRAAVAQSGAAGRAGGDARSRLRRPARFRHRQGLPAQRVHRVRDSARTEAEARFEEALEVITRSFRSRAALLASRPLLALRGHRGRAAAGAAAASAVLGRGRERRVDPQGRRARLQSHSRPVRRARGDRRAHRALPRASARRMATASIRCRSTVARQLYVAKDRADAEAALARQAMYTQRTVGVARAPDGQGRLARARLCGHGRGHRGQCALRHARRDLREARGARAGRRRLCPAHDLRRQGATAPLRARDHAGVFRLRRSWRARPLANRAPREPRA